MSILTILEEIQSFLQEKVAPGIKLQKANDKNVNAYELVNPQVHVGWVPPKGYLPEGMESAIPCLIVGMDEASDSGQDSEISIRISAAVYSPGRHEPSEGGVIKYTPDFQGYHDLLNLIDKTTAQLHRNLVISNAVTIQTPIRSGIYQEQPYPYWYGWITFSVWKKSYPAAEILRNL